MPRDIDDIPLSHEQETLAEEEDLLEQVPASPTPKVILFILISLLVHLVLFYLLLPPWEKWSLPLNTPKNPNTIQVEILPHDLKLADIPKPEHEETPKNAKFAALYNQKVKQEQVAKTRPPSPHPQPSPPTPSPHPSQASNGASIAMRFGGGAYPEEFFPDYSYGNHTYVNALRYPNIQYFVELKRRFTTAFNPIPALREHRAELRGSKIEVVLGVTVNDSGNLSELVVIRNSGLPAYDDNAMKTVKTSAPFRSPPTNLLDKDHLLRMSWTFTVSFE